MSTFTYDIAFHGIITGMTIHFARVFEDIGTQVEIIAPYIIKKKHKLSLTSVLSKVQESYAVEWIIEDVQEEISVSQFGGLAGSSAVLALVYLVHNWHKNMDSVGKVVRVSLLDFRKAYDLINHNKLWENFMNIGVRPP